MMLAQGENAGMLFMGKRDLTNFTHWRASYCRMMSYLIREKLHLKILFTLICIALVVGFAYFHYQRSEAPFRPIPHIGD